MSTLANHIGQSNHKQEGEHGSNRDSTADGSTIDPESWAYWDRACAALPPMTPEEIEAVAVILRRINARRAGGTTPAKAER